MKPAAKQRAQRQAFERGAQLAEHVLNIRALGEIALVVQICAETEQVFATIKVVADARPLRVFPWGRISFQVISDFPGSFKSSRDTIGKARYVRPLRLGDEGLTESSVRSSGPKAPR